ncbi:hypothetical protein [Propionivibrio sp.]|uniref:hypothetical protein n=1 Tax=Propionivibrio sp. TaxID=2212460 RepID=UPI003BEFC063
MNARETRTAILLIGWHGQHTVPPLRKVRAMLPLIDKPMLQVATEALVRLGCQTFHVFLDDQPETVRHFLGNGERWGIKVTYHYRDQEQTLASNLKRLSLAPDEAHWLASAESIPGELINPAEDKVVAADTAFCWQSGAAHPHPNLPLEGEGEGQQCWTGWGLFLGRTLNTFSHLDSHQTLETTITEDRRITRQLVSAPFDLSSDKRYLESSIRRLHAVAKEADSTIMIARGARINPSTKLIGPVYIGQNARIEADTLIGPNAVIGHDAIVDLGAEIRDSVILPETYVGGGLFLEQAVAAPGALASIKNSALLSKIEPHLLASAQSSVYQQPFRRYLSMLSMILLRVLLFPLYAAGRLIMKEAGQNFRTITTLRIFRPASHGLAPEIIALPIANTAHYLPLHPQQNWLQHFVHIFYPGLHAVARDQIKLFGLELRDVADVAKLPEHWQSLYHAHSCGLLNESMLQPAVATDPALRYASDACAVAGLPRKTQWRIIVNYFGHVMNDGGRLLRSTLISKKKNELPFHY